MTQKVFIAKRKRTRRVGKKIRKPGQVQFVCAEDLAEAKALVVGRPSDFNFKQTDLAEVTPDMRLDEAGEIKTGPLNDEEALANIEAVYPGVGEFVDRMLRPLRDRIEELEKGAK